MADKNIIEVTGLKKSFGKFDVLKGISFFLKKGEILGLLGPNGAGKTTTIQILLGITTLSAGNVELFGLKIGKHREKILSKVNFASAYVQLPERLTVTENLKIFATLYDIRSKDQKIAELLEAFQISDLKDKPVGQLSAGQKTRVSFAKALLNDPEILLLDEPMASLDPEAADRARTLLTNIQKTRSLSILYTSHNMDEVEQLCDRVIFLHHGEIVAQGTPHQVTEQVLKASASEPDLEKVFITLAREGENYEGT